ncbi:hypothetical protein ACHAWC_011687 [Mediolabrus comicus]
MLSLSSAFFASSSYFRLATSADNLLTSPASPSINSIAALSSIISALESRCVIRRDSFSSLKVVSTVFFSVSSSFKRRFSTEASSCSAAFASSSYFRLATSAAKWFTSPASPSIDSIVALSSVISALESLCTMRRESFSSLSVVNSAFVPDSSSPKRLNSAVDSIHSAFFASSSYFRLATSADK